MRRNIRSHTHGDTVRTVYKQIGKARRKHHRLFFAAVEVGDKIHRFFIQVFQHFRRKFGKPRLGVTHRRGGIAVYAAEVAVPVHQRKVDSEILRQTNQRVVNGRIAVRVKFTHAIAYDTRAFSERFVVI